jgi:hypothetical protein
VGNRLDEENVGVVSGSMERAEAQSGSNSVDKLRRRECG